MRMPGASPGEPMNSIPAASSAFWICTIILTVLSGIPSTLSIFAIVRSETPEASDSPFPDHPNAPLAARICDPLSTCYRPYMHIMCTYMLKKCKHSSILSDWRLEFKRLEGAYAPATMRAYYADVTMFVEWCKERAFDPFPATPEVITKFLEHQSCDKSISTIRRRLCSLRKAHQLLKLPDPTTEQDVALAIRRIHRSKFSRPRQAKGLTQDYLKMFMELQPNTPWGLRNQAMLALGYDLLTRRSELVALNVQDLEFRNDGTLKVLIRRSKSDPFGYGRHAFTSQATAELVAEWLDWRGTEVAPLFCPIYHDVLIDRRLSVTTVKRIIKTSAKDAGLPKSEVDAFSGHSLRVGAAQDLLRRGVSTANIMRAGGWKSISVLARYLENADCNVWETTPT